MLRTATAAAALAVAIAASGCGEGPPGQEPRAAAPPPPAAGAPGVDVRVIRKWSEELRKGRIDGASALFGVPATVENGTGPLVLDSRRQVFGFNESLPCGAKLLVTARRGPYTVATFRLTERPGGDCGTGGGTKASTAFRIEDGKIVEWLRVSVPAEKPRPQPGPKRPPSDRRSPSETI